MEITYAVYVNDTLVGEADLLARVATYQGYFPKGQDPDGLVTLPATRRGEPLQFGDNLTYLVTQLCFQSIPPLAAGEKAVVDFFSSPAEVVLTPEGDSVVLSSSEFPETFAFPRAEFLRALFDCGTRYLAFLKQVQVDTPNPVPPQPDDTDDFPVLPPDEGVPEDEGPPEAPPVILGDGPGKRQSLDETVSRAQAALDRVA